jgi:arylformamidase
MKVIDISKGFLSAPVYPGDPKPELTLATDRRKGDMCTASNLYASVHTSTHWDAYSHFSDNGISIDQMPLEHFMGKCLVISVPRGEVPDAYLAEKIPQGSKRVLIKGGGKSYLSPSAGNILEKKGVITIGTDHWSVGNLDTEEAVHKPILDKHIAILEGLDLSKVEDGEYMMYALPIKFEGCDGAYTRAILIEE